MTVKKLFLFGQVIVSIITAFSGPIAAQSSSIRATATVIKPIGVNSIETEYNNDSADTRLSIRKPENSAVLCSIEVDGILLDEYTIRDQEDILITSDLIKSEVEQSNSVCCDIVITLVYSEN